MPEQDKSLDILGIKPVAEAINTVTKASTDGVGALLSRICLPAAEEMGLLFKDKVHAWRAKNAISIAATAEQHLSSGTQKTQAHPRIVSAIFDQGSWSDDESVQKLWGGLLASSCTETGTNQDNLIFINLLTQLTPSEVKLIQYACEKSVKLKSSMGLIFAHDGLNVSANEALAISGLKDIHRLDLELDHLRDLGLLRLTGGFSFSPEDSAGNLNDTPASLTPSAKALQFYARCNGFNGPATDFYGLNDT